MAAAAGDVVMLLQIPFEGIAQSRAAFLPLLFCGNAFPHFVPGVFRAAVGLE